MGKKNLYVSTVNTVFVETVWDMTMGVLKMQVPKLWDKMS